MADTGIMASIHAAAFPAADAWSRDVFSLHIQLPNVIGLIDAQEALILARVAAGDAEILTLAVIPVARRRGKATRLLNEASNRLAAAGAEVVYLEVSVENTMALSLYLRIGFVHTGRRRGYYSNGSDALVLRRNLISVA